MSFIKPRKQTTQDYDVVVNYNGNGEEVSKRIIEAMTRPVSDEPSPKLIQFPHCDNLILHSPGICEYCDRHPEWQDLRKAQGIAFSDTPIPEVFEKNFVPCPSTWHRSQTLRDYWAGNQPAASAPAPPPARTYLQKLIQRNGGAVPVDDLVNDVLSENITLTRNDVLRLVHDALKAGELALDDQFRIVLSD